MSIKIDINKTDEISDSSTSLIKNNIILLNKVAEYFRLLIKYDINDEVLDKEHTIEYTTTRTVYVYSSFNDTITLVGINKVLYISGFIYDTKLLELNIMTQFGKFNNPQNHKVLKQLNSQHMYRYPLLLLSMAGLNQISLSTTLDIENYSGDESYTFKDAMYDLLYSIDNIDYKLYYNIISYIDAHVKPTPIPPFEFRDKPLFINKDFLAFLQFNSKESNRLLFGDKLGI